MCKHTNARADAATDSSDKWQGNVLKQKVKEQDKRKPPQRSCHIKTEDSRSQVAFPFLENVQRQKILSKQ